MERFFAELTALTDLVNAGAPGLTAVQRLVELAQQTIGGAGATFAEYGSSGGRVIAASGAAVWGVGRYIEPSAPLVVRLSSGERVIEAGLDAMPPDFASHLEGAGVR